MTNSKFCLVCGRLIEPRKKWIKNWDQIKYCSDRCRLEKNKTQNFEIAIIELLKQRGSGKTICPSEVLSPDQKQNKYLMEEVRRSARKLVEQDLLLILQKGIVVEPSTAKGPIRLKLKIH